MAVTPNGRTMATFDDCGDLTIFDVVTRRAIHTMRSDYHIAGDFDGDGQQDSGSFHEGTWRIHLADPPGAGRRRKDAERTVQFGDRCDVPVVGDWDGDGRSDLGCYRRVDSQFSFDLDGQGGQPERTFALGQAGAMALPQIPLAGRWEDRSHDSVALAVWRSAENWRWWFPKQAQTAIIDMPSANRSIPISGPEGTWGFWYQGRIWTTAMPATDWIATKSEPQVLKRKGPMHPKFSMANRSQIAVDALDAAKDRTFVPGASYMSERSLAISPDAALVALAFADDDRVKILEPASGRRVATLRVTSGYVEDVGFSPDGRSLAVGTSTGTIALFDVATFKLARQFKAHGVLHCLCYAPDGQTLFSAGDQGAVSVWRSDGSLLRTLLPRESPRVLSLAASPSGRFLAVGCSDRVARVINLDTSALAASIAGHAADVQSLAFSADETCLATACADQGSIRLWDLHTGQELLRFKDTEEQVYHLEFCASTGELIAATKNTTIDGHTGTIHAWTPTQSRIPPHGGSTP